MIVESTIFDKINDRCDKSFETTVCSKCGNVDVMTSRNNRIYYGFQFMIDNNIYPKERRANGTKYIECSIQQRKNCSKL